METPLCSAHKGAIAELTACNWLLRQGFEVFRNVSGAGPADLVVWNPATGRMIPVDVKSIESPFVRQDGGITLASRPPCPHGTHHLFVVAGEVVGFARRLETGRGSELYDALAEIA